MVVIIFFNFNFMDQAWGHFAITFKLMEKIKIIRLFHLSSK